MIVYFSGLIAMFVVEIYLYLRRGLKCCVSLRAVLGCAGGPGAPCRGFKGTCTALKAQFAGVYGSGVASFTCRDFPNPNSTTHTIAAGIICAAAGWPVLVLLEAR